MNNIQTNSTRTTQRVRWSNIGVTMPLRIVVMAVVMLLIAYWQIANPNSNMPIAFAEHPAAPMALTKDFSQCADDSSAGVGNCDWINGILNRNNSRYAEGRGVPQRLILDGVAATAGDLHTVTFQVLWTKGGSHAYDWLMSYDQAIATASYYGRPFNNLNGQVCDPANSLTSVCTTLRSSAGYYFDVVVPDDPYISHDGATQERITAFESIFGNRTIRLYGSSPIASASLSLVHDNITDTGDSYVLYTLQYTSPATQTMLEMAGHLAITAYPNTNPMAWGVPNGSASISGGPYHFKMEQVDGGSIGNLDNQIQSSEIAGPPTMSTQRSSPALLNVGVRDTANLTGTKDAGAVSGSILFYICADNYAPYTDTIQPANGCNINASNNPPTFSVTYLGTQTVATSGTNTPIGTATSVPFTPTKNGYYCFTAVYSPAPGANYLTMTHSVNDGTECFLIQDATAVTIVDLSVRSNGNWLAFAMGVSGVLILGAMLFVYRRRTQ